MSNSTAIQRIAYAWALSFAPHVIKLTLLGTSGYKWDNSIGRHNMSKDAANMRVSQSALSSAQKADAAHQNGNESFPLFAAAVLAAVASGVDADAVDYGTKLYLGLRVVYIALFLFGGSNQAIAGLRTLTWGGSVWASISLILQSSKVLAAKGM